MLPTTWTKFCANVVSRHSPSRLRMPWRFGHFRCTIATHLTDARCVTDAEEMTIVTRDPKVLEYAVPNIVA